MSIRGCPVRRWDVSNRTGDGEGFITVAQYLIMIYEDENAYATAPPDEWQRIGKLHGQFAEQVGDKILGGNALQPTQTATSIRADVVTDGPFVETKEVLGGYYLIEAKDLDEALEVAKLCPAPHGGVEVRPIMDTSGMM